MQSTAPEPNDNAYSRIVQAQLDAYNARDIDAFMVHWAEDAQVFAHPDTLVASGAAEIRARHMMRFQEPNLFGRLVHRIVVGNVVVDHEVVARTFPEGPGKIEVVATYELTEDSTGPKIRRAWFIMDKPVLD